MPVNLSDPLKLANLNIQKDCQNLSKPNIEMIFLSP